MLLTVNELSNTIDLDSILIRAEALCRRFQRLVEAIDKKQNFPAPRQQSDGSPANTADVGSSSNADETPAEAPRPVPKHARPTGKGKGKGKGGAKQPPAQKPSADAEKVITPELRGLLSRKVEVLPRKTVAQKGEGMPAA